MSATPVIRTAIAAVLTAAALVFPASARAISSHPGAVVMTRTQGGLAPARVSLAFEPNRGQTDSRVRYLAHGPGYTLFLTDRGAVVSLSQAAGHQPMRLPQQRAMPMVQPASGKQAVLELLPQGMGRHVRITIEEKLPGVVSYFIGNNPAKWHAGIPTYGRVVYHDVYPGIDLVFHGSAGQPEYDWVVRPRADASKIRLRIAGAKALSIDHAGGLGMMTSLGRIEQARPHVFQEANREIAGGFVIRGKNIVGIRLGSYDRSREVVIDPTLVLGYSTYLGGSSDDYANGIAVDGSGNTYVTGWTESTDFPVCGSNPTCASPGTAIQPDNAGNSDVFVTKLNAAGTQLLYSNYLGGSGYEYGGGIAVDGSGNAYVTGYTTSSDFPVCGTNPTCASPGSAIQSSNAGGYDAFVSKLNASGTQLLYSTYLGGSGEDDGFGIAVDGSGNAYVTGRTTSSDFPICPDNGGAHAYCASDTGSPVQPANAGYYDVFVSKLNTAGTELLYSTYLGGSGYDFGLAIAVDGSGNAYVTGLTGYGDFPVCGSNPKCASPGSAIQSSNAGRWDAFVTKLNPTGTQLLYSTYLGGSGDDLSYGIAVDGSGNAYVMGQTSSSDFPICPDNGGAHAYCASHTGSPVQSSNAGGWDAFVSKISVINRRPPNTPCSVTVCPWAAFHFSDQLTGVRGNGYFREYPGASFIGNLTWRDGRPNGLVIPTCTTLSGSCRLVIDEIACTGNGGGQIYGKWIYGASHDFAVILQDNDPSGGESTDTVQLQTTNQFGNAYAYTESAYAIANLTCP